MVYMVSKAAEIEIKETRQDSFCEPIAVYHITLAE